MANTYCTATNTGKNFFTHEDRNDFYLSGHPDNVWIVGDSSCKECGTSSDKKGLAWISRVNGTIITKAEAQALVDAKVVAGQAEYDAQSAEEKLKLQPGRFEKYTLP